MTSSTRPIIIVTGGNGGVGFGVCQRLLFELCQKSPRDASPAFGPASQDIPREKDLFKLPCEGLTLILACRNASRGAAAQKLLYSSLDAHIRKLSRSANYDGHADIFRRNLRIEVHILNLAILRSVLEFSQEISQKYPYISHFICNAGVAAFSVINWPAAIRQICTSPMQAVTAPAFYGQHSGELTIDSIGYVFQCNIFSHYVLIRTLQPLLSSSAYPYDSRVIWTSSIEASPKYYSIDDWQLRKTNHSYESVKWQIDMLASKLDQLSLKSIPDSRKRIRHFVGHPSVCHTEIAMSLTGPILDAIKLVLFYLARLFGSPNHPIAPYKAAICSVYIALVPLSFLTFSAGTRPIKYGSQTDRWGTEKVGYSEVVGWDERQSEAQHLLDNCETLLQQTLEEARPRELNFETASEKM
ncbi:hypothetical protein C8J56DRAFT_543925 [Mycena floridula]|nr:hypothetical protein C8J56DRAFT_543925 [Mycena floridula]